MPLVHRQLLGHTKRPAPWDNAHLVDRIGLRQKKRHKSMSRLMNGGTSFLFVGDYHRTPLRPHHHLVFGKLEMAHADLRCIFTRRHQSRLVAKIGQISSCKPGGTSGENLELDIIAYRDVFGMNLQDCFPARNIGFWYNNLPIKPAWPKKSRVEHIRAVCRRNNNSGGICLKPVHLDKELVKGLFAFVMATA